MSLRASLKGQWQKVVPFDPCIEFESANLTFRDRSRLCFGHQELSLALNILAVSVRRIDVVCRQLAIDICINSSF